MSVNEMLMAAAGSAGPATFIEDVFSTYLYTGNGSTQTITNNIDLSGKGGLVWAKWRSGVLGSADHALFDTSRGVSKRLSSNTTDGESTNSGVSAFGSTGFTLGSAGTENTNNALYCSWTFRKQAKFFDVVTFTSSAGPQTISHNLGATPGMMIVKCTTVPDAWYVWHRSIPNNALALNTTQSTSTYNSPEYVFGNGTVVVQPTSTQFTFYAGNSGSNTYVAYLFAHNAGGFGTAGTDNVISCGSFTGGDTVNLGYEPQYVLYKASAVASNWRIIDNMRGMPQAGDPSPVLVSNLSSAETTHDLINPTATGFTSGANGTAYIYIAIRRGPMKTPTSGTQVFSPVAYTGNGTTRSYSVGFPTDLSINMNRDEVGDAPTLNDRLRGLTDLYTNATQAETTTSQSARVQFDNQTNIIVPNFRITNTIKYIDWCFRRAPGFLDIVCYTGTGSATTFSHNLGVVPELMIVKNRSDATGRAWAVYAGDNTDYLVLNTTAATADDNTYWNDTSPTSSVFSVGTNNSTNESSDTFVAYLFATVTGVSKVGSYTGTAAAQTINCGFTAGARWVMIKRTDSTGDWYVWDTARGIVSGNDPYLLLNSSAAEVTNTDYIDPVNSGFELSSTAPAAINANGGSFIFMAIA